MNTWSALIVGRLVDFYLFSAVLLAIALLAMRWLVRDPARRMTWSWGVTASLALVAAGLLIPGLRQTPQQWLSRFAPEPIVKEPAELMEMTNNAPIIPPLAANAEEIITLPELPVATEAVAPPSLIWPAVRLSLATAWCSAAVLITTWLLIGAFQVRRIKRRATKVPEWAHDELAKIVRGKSPPLFASQHVQTAVALDALRPHILLPAAEVHDDNQAAVRASIRHEWAHIAHGDLWLHGIQRLLTIILFAHPLYWFFRRQTRADQELLADAAASGNDPLGYAETLLTWARQLATRDPKFRNCAAESLGLTMWRDASSLQRRIEMLVDQKSSSYVQPGRFGRAAVIVLLLLGSAALSTITVNSQEKGPEADTPITDVISQHSSHGDVIQGKDQGGKRHVTITQQPDRLVIQVHESVLGPDLETTYAAKDAATLQRRHPEIFRLYERFTAAARKDAPWANLAAKIRDSKFIPPPPAWQGTKDEAPIFLIDSTIGEISNAAIFDHDVNLETVFPSSLQPTLQIQGDLLIAICTPKEAEQIRGRLNEAKALTIVSRPRLVTTSDNTASIRVGSDVPFVTKSDDSLPKQVGMQFEGIAVDISPSLTMSSQDQKPQLGLELKAELSERTKPAPKTVDGRPELKRRALKFKVDFEPGKVLVVTERPSKDDAKDKNLETLFLQVNMQPVTPEELKAAQQSTPTLNNNPNAPPPRVSAANAEINPLVMALQSENQQLKAQLHAVQAQQAMLQSQIERQALRSESTRVAANNAPPPTAAPKYTPGSAVKIYRLKNATASAMQALLADLTQEDKSEIRIAVDERTNSLIVSATPPLQDVVTELLERLDEPPAKKADPANPLANPAAKPQATPAPQPKSVLDKQLQELEIMEAEAVLQSAQTRFSRLQAMHKSGQVSAAELTAAETEARAAAVTLERARRPNDARFLAEADLQLAETKLDGAKRAFGIAEAQNKTGTISAEEVGKLELELRRAEIAVRRAKLHLDAMSKEAPTLRRN